MYSSLGIIIISSFLLYMSSLFFYTNMNEWMNEWMNEYRMWALCVFVCAYICV